MTRKRGINSIFDKPKKARKSVNSALNTTPAKQVPNILNNSLMDLYKTEKDEDIEEFFNKNDEKIQENEVKEKKETEASKTPKPGKKRKTVAVIPKYSSITFDDVGGMENIKKDLVELFMHYRHASIYTNMNISPARGILLHGPPGCGKSHLARATAGMLEVPLIEVAATSLVHGIPGESEHKVRETFDAALATGRCILFIDGIEAICPKRQTTESEMLKRMTAQMTQCFDELHAKDPAANIMVLAATNNPDAIDHALRGGLRFGIELAIEIPNEEARLKILEVLLKGMPNIDLNLLAHHTPGYVGADLVILRTRAIRSYLSRLYEKFVESGFTESQTIDPDMPVAVSNGLTESQISDPDMPVADSNGLTESQIIDLDMPVADSNLTESSKPLSLYSRKIRYFFHHSNISDEDIKSTPITTEDFQIALQHCVPYSKREGFASVPTTTWDDVGALEDIKKELRRSILWPVKYKSQYERCKASSSQGILLYGPKGCGKTLVAKAIANECSINFLSVDGSELLNMYVGESEKAVRKTFERAKNCAPCVIFFDEFDALCPPRSSTKENAPVERVVNQILTESDGVQNRQQVFLIAATNRLDKIDSAMLRPGRLDKVLYVGLPTPAGRVDILKSLTKNKTEPKFADDLELETIGLDPRCEDFSGADLGHLIREATAEAMEPILGTSTDLVLERKHFERAFQVVKASFTEKDRIYFERTMSHEPPRRRIIAAAPCKK